MRLCAICGCFGIFKATVMICVGHQIQWIHDTYFRQARKVRSHEKGCQWAPGYCNNNTINSTAHNSSQAYLGSHSGCTLASPAFLFVSFDPRSVSAEKYIAFDVLSLMEGRISSLRVGLSVKQKVPGISTWAGPRPSCTCDQA